MLNIRFKIGKKEYSLRSSKYDFILEEVKIRGEESKNAGEEWLDLVGNCSTMHGIFRYLYQEHHLRTSEIESVQGMVDELETVISSVQDTLSDITKECFISPDDKKSLVKRLEEAENEIDRLKKENKALKKGD